jgi:acetyl-CoA synthetase
MISPTPGIELVPLKPGSATFPLPGVNADIFDESGKSVPPGEKGYLVIKSPWPGMLMGVYGDPERYQETYWSKFPGMYYTGDYAIRDKDGYFWLLGRADEVLKIAGHRIGTIEIEDAVVSHEAIVEAAVASKPDPIKGECVVVFAIPKQGVEPTPELKKSIKDHIRKTLGPVATPDEIYFVTKLPKTRSGKIMRRVLKAVASGTTIGDLTTLEDGTSVDEVKKAFEELQKKV